MPLSTPSVAREALHTRKVTCRGWFRADGMWDIEGHITDEKHYEHDNEWRGALAAGDFVHQMWIRLTVDRTMTIHAVEATTDHSPYRMCPQITPNFQRLIGLRIAGGFHRAARERLGGVHGCTHLVELLGPVATTAFQTIGSDKARDLHRAWREAERAAGRLPPAEPRPTDRPKRRPSILDTCHAWASDGPVVQRWYPDFYTGDKKNEEAAP